jgi:hypothetical protein
MNPDTWDIDENENEYDKMEASDHIRLKAEMYDNQETAIRRALYDRWRGVAYYRCCNCNECGAPDQFHIVPVHHDDHDPDNLQVQLLQPLCKSCYLYFTNNGEDHIVG